MKKTGNRNEKARAPFFTKKDEIKATDLSDLGIRHVEDPVSFLNEANITGGNYGQPEDMKGSWGLSKNDATVKRGRRHTFVRFVAAVVVVILVLSSVFYFLPKILPGFFKGTNIELFVEREVVLEYDENYRVVTVSSANVMSRPLISSDCITQVLYNEPVRLLESESGNGYCRIETLDGVNGFVKADVLTEDTSSVEPDLHEYKLVVSETKKNIMSHASQGTLIREVMMNTVLYADVKRDGVYQVSLPGGEVGWIGSSGVIEIGPREEIEEVSCRYFVSSALSLVNSRYIENGITMNGMSVNGLVYVCSCVNGIPMPRSTEEQAEMGVEVIPEYDVVTGELLIENIIPGDILFLSSPYSPGSDEIYEMAVCTDTGTLLKVSSSGTTIRLVSFDPSSELCSRIICIRRVFSE